jgi:hypothetical protein
MKMLKESICLSKKSMIPKCHTYKLVTDSLRFGQNQSSVVRIEDGILLARRIDLGCVSLDLRRLMIDLVVYLGQKCRSCGREPSPAAELE